MRKICGKYPLQTLTREIDTKSLEETKDSDMNRLKGREVVEVEHVIVAERVTADLNGFELGTVLNLEYACSLMTKENDIRTLCQGERPSSNNNDFQFIQPFQTKVLSLFKTVGTDGELS